MKHPHAKKMDAVYRYQKHFYDFSRKLILLGRDQILQNIHPAPGEKILEVGCGTARNLIQLQKQHPQAKLFGLDASQEMLSIAQKKIPPSITLQQGLAEELHYQKTFHQNTPFDYAFFSYSLTMISNWQEALRSTAKNLKPNGQIYIVDFWDQSQHPRILAHALKKWLSLFHVHYDPEMVPFLQQEKIFSEVEVHSIWKHYAFWARVRVR